MIPPYRITKIVCPSCRGSGCKSSSGPAGSTVSFPCAWCYGARRMGVASAISYAEHLHASSNSLFLDGLITKGEAAQDEAHALAICALAQQPASWVRVE